MLTIYLRATIVLLLFVFQDVHLSTSCRDRSSDLRLDGGLCFEVPPWQHQPVELDDHLKKVRSLLPANQAHVNDISGYSGLRSMVLSNNEISRYMDTVIAPYLDTYHRNIQNSYQQMTDKLLKKIKEELNAGVLRRQEIFKSISKLADELNVPEMCNEERRMALTIANQHVAFLYRCTEVSRASIAKMGRYSEEMINITRAHMHRALGKTKQVMSEQNRDQVSKQNSNQNYLNELSHAAVRLGYELDLSLTNARRHNQQSCEKLTSCSSKSKKATDEAVAELKEMLYQCVYA